MLGVVAVVFVVVVVERSNLLSTSFGDDFIIARILFIYYLSSYVACRIDTAPANNDRAIVLCYKY